MGRKALWYVSNDVNYTVDCSESISMKIGSVGSEGGSREPVADTLSHPLISPSHPSFSNCRFHVSSYTSVQRGTGRRAISYTIPAYSYLSNKHSNQMTFLYTTLDTLLHLYPNPSDPADVSQCLHRRARLWEWPHQVSPLNLSPSRAWGEYQFTE